MHLDKILYKPVPFDEFKYLFQIFTAAADLSMPVESPSAYSFELDGAGYVPTDIPINRGMLAIVKEASSTEVYFSTAARIFELGRIADDKRFSKFVQVDEDGEVCAIGESLLYAVSQVKMKTPGILNKKQVHKLAKNYVGDSDG